MIRVCYAPLAGVDGASAPTGAGPDGRVGTPDDTGTDPTARRSDWSDPTAHPQPPSREPDSYLPAGDPVYHRSGSTAIGYDTALCATSTLPRRSRDITTSWCTANATASSGPAR
ncbi:hypothetical protein GCM10010166_11480 [Couchioplanes caeruleus subsp. azureus]|nr:hypothetical protein GCM10010166_11480 [Couchioplanes caeruleus subsp. azureus]